VYNSQNLLLFDKKYQFHKFDCLMQYVLTPKMNSRLMEFFGSLPLLPLACSVEDIPMNLPIINIPLISSTKHGCFSSKKRTLLLCFD